MGFTLFQGDVIELRLPGFSNRFGAYPINPGLVYNQTSYLTQNVESEFVDDGGWAALKNITSADVFTTPQTGLPGDGPVGRLLVRGRQRNGLHVELRQTDR